MEGTHSLHKDLDNFCHFSKHHFFGLQTFALKGKQELKKENYNYIENSPFICCNFTAKFPEFYEEEKNINLVL